MEASEKSSGSIDRRYSKGEHRWKHASREPGAQIVYENGLWVGKCPKDFPLDTAEKLLKKGIPENRSSTGEVPRRIWVYYDGVVYAARSEDRGTTWHGFPHGQPMGPVPSKILRRLREQAKAAGDDRGVDRWLDKRWE